MEFNRVRKLRIYYGIKLEELANSSKISISTLRRVELNQKCKKNNLLKISLGFNKMLNLNLSIKDLFEKQNVI